MDSLGNLLRLQAKETTASSPEFKFQALSRTGQGIVDPEGPGAEMELPRSQGGM